MNDLYFLKLGGSLITDKTGVEVVREEVLTRLVQEIKEALTIRPALKIVLGHGSGSFGHVFGAKYGTRQGVETTYQWYGFTEVAASAARLNKFVVEALLAVGLAAICLSPSASAFCVDGRIVEIAVEPIQQALAVGVLPVVHGDVAFDRVRGGTIASTEEVMMALANTLRPSWLLLAGETNGVYNLQQQVIPAITRANFDDVKEALGESRGTDVTGGMASKVRDMLDLADEHSQMAIRIFSGLVPGELKRVLLKPATASGTIIRQ